MKPSRNTQTLPLGERFRDAWTPTPRKRGLLPVETITLAYLLFTAAFVLVCYGSVLHPVSMLVQRAGIVAIMAALYFVHQAHPCEATRFLRSLFPLTLLGYWYPDTFEFCQLFPNLDHVFAETDQLLFGCQPSVVFSQMFGGKAWSEAFYLGYFSYYPLILVTVLLSLFSDRRSYERTAFVVLCSFFLFYLIYLFLPVAGPQYYFQAIGLENVANADFIHIGHYFRTHFDMLPAPGPEGLFRSMVEATQAGGERPTAAFPSSHVGVSTILMILLVRHHRRAALLCLPFYVLLCFSTVYIQAHYLVDVLGGFVTAVPVYLLSCRAYKLLHRRDRRPRR